MYQFKLNDKNLNSKLKYYPKRNLYIHCFNCNYYSTNNKEFSYVNYINYINLNKLNNKLNYKIIHNYICYYCINYIFKKCIKCNKLFNINGLIYKYDFKICVKCHILNH